ncbi:MAG: hypothetical protein AAF401_19320 [Pseudomonadota bacterium]
MAPVLAYVGKLTKAPSSVGQADVDAMKAAGWEDAAVTRAAEIEALFGFMNRIVEGHGVSADDATLSASGEALARGGYAPIAASLGA